MAEPTLVVEPFQPYAAVPLLRWLKDAPTTRRLVAVLTPAVALILLAGAASHGMVGSLADFQPLQDILRAAGVKPLRPDDPFHYPLIRDIPVWFCAVIMIAEVAILRVQWARFATGLTDLADSGAVLAPVVQARKQDPDGGEAVDEVPPHLRLAEYVRRLNKINADRAGRRTTVHLLLAMGLAALLMWGEREGTFRVLIPPGLEAARQQEWRSAAYHQWWASVDHPAGAIAYFVLTSVVIYIIIAQTHVGMHAARIAAQLPALTRLSADWTNRDGDYGWRPLRKVFHTVWLSMALYGLLVSALAVIMGLGRVGWIPALVWIALLVFYIVIPWMSIRKIEGAARRQHTADAYAQLPRTTVAEKAALREHIEAIRRVRIRPMRVRPRTRVVVLISVLLPLALNVTSSTAQLVNELLRR